MITLNDLYQLFLSYPQVSTDTRTIKKGSLFFALKGNRFNGNLFAQEALKKGAVYAIVDESLPHQDKRILRVPDVLQVLQQLARLHRDSLNVKILAITGTNGKTTTKELVATVLSRKYPLIYTHGNLNNHIGVPLTLLRLTPEHQWGIIEMGASKPGDINELCEIANPDAGMITNCGRAHLEGFGSPEGVVQTKTELYAFLAHKKGTVLYHAEDDLIKQQVDRFPDLQTYSYGTGEKCYCRGEMIEANPFVHLLLYYDTNPTHIRSQLTGTYNFSNIMAAACTGKMMKIDVNNIREAIEQYVPSNNRSQLTYTKMNTLVVDCYNANPTSMKAAIESFLSLPSERKKILILGDMLELGPYSDAEHKAVVDSLKDKAGIEVWLVGENFSRHAGQCRAFKTAEELVDYLKKHPLSEATILLKGSRGIMLEKALEYL